MGERRLAPAQAPELGGIGGAADGAGGVGGGDDLEAGQAAPIDLNRFEHRRQFGNRMAG